MELHKAIKEIVASKGADMICNIQIINYLLDYQAFKEKPATKLILRDVINSGFTNLICNLDTKAPDWQTKYLRYQHDFIEVFGYKEDLAIYVFEAIAYGLGMNVVHSHHIHDTNDSNKENISKCKEPQIISDIHNEVSLPKGKKVQYMEPKLLVSKDDLLSFVHNYLMFKSSVQASIDSSYRMYKSEFKQLQKMGIISYKSSTEYKNNIRRCVYSIMVRDYNEVLRIIDEYYSDYKELR